MAKTTLKKLNDELKKPFLDWDLINILLNDCVKEDTKRQEKEALLKAKQDQIISLIKEVCR